MANDKKNDPISEFSPEAALRPSKTKSMPYRASFLLIMDRLSGVDRTRTVRPSAS